jgi:hypothetical protein
MSPRHRTTGDAKERPNQPGIRGLPVRTTRRRASLAVTVAALLVVVTAIGVVP